MIDFQLIGDWKGASKRLAWMRKHWQEIARVLVRRAVLSLAEEAGLREPEITFIKVEREGGRSVSYGVAVEPTLEDVKIGSLRGRVVFLELERERASRDLLEMAAHGPWVVNALPMVPAADVGHLVVREGGLDELEAVLLRNKRFLRDRPLLITTAQRGILATINLRDATPPMLLPPDREVRAEEDKAYNLTRGEFGLGDKINGAVWRPALMRLIQQRLDLILEDLVDDIADGATDLLDEEDRFEERSERWLKSTRSFALMFNEEEEEPNL